KNLAKSGGAEAFAGLSKALKHEKVRVRLTAAEGLAQSRIPKEKIDLAPLAAAWESEDSPLVCAKIFEALIAIDPNAKATKEIVVETLARFGATHIKNINSPSLVKYLCQALNSPKENVRSAAVESLAGFGPKAKEAIPVLKELLDKTKGEERADIQFAL